MTVQREEHWYNGGEYFRYHYHTWTVDDWYVNAIWEDTYRGIIQCNASISDISKREILQSLVFHSKSLMILFLKHVFYVRGCICLYSI